jgi:hypothetical protein
MEQIKPNKRYLLAQDEDLSLNLSLKTNFNELNEFNNSKIISLTELFTKERNESTKYRIYGNINYFSFLRNKKENSIFKNPSESAINNVFKESITNTFFNLENFFDIKLFRLKKIQDTYDSINSTFFEKLEVISGDSVLNYFTYSRNLFNERNYYFTFNTSILNPKELILLSSSTGIDIIYDNSVYLGFTPKISNNSRVYEKLYYVTDYVNEVDQGSQFGYTPTPFTDSQINDIVTDSEFSIEDFKKYFLSKLDLFFRIYNLEKTDTNISLNTRFIRNYLDIGNGDYNKKVIVTNIKEIQTSNFDLSNVERNFIYFNKQNYTFNNILEKEYLIKLSYKDEKLGIINDDTAFDNYVNENYSGFTFIRSDVDKFIMIDFWFKFKPFNKIELKRYSDFLNEVYTANTQNTIQIPENGVFYEDRYIWRDLLIYGDAENYDYPFVNNNHYVFNNILFYLKPDLSDRNTVVLVNEFLTNYRINTYTFNTDNIKPNIKKRKSIC